MLDVKAAVLYFLVRLEERLLSDMQAGKDGENNNNTECKTTVTIWEIKLANYNLPKLLCKQTTYYFVPVLSVVSGMHYSLCYMLPLLFFFYKPNIRIQVLPIQRIATSFETSDYYTQRVSTSKLRLSFWIHVQAFIINICNTKSYFMCVCVLVYSQTYT